MHVDLEELLNWNRFLHRIIFNDLVPNDRTFLSAAKLEVGGALGCPWVMMEDNGRDGVLERKFADALERLNFVNNLIRILFHLNILLDDAAGLQFFLVVDRTSFSCAWADSCLDVLSALDRTLIVFDFCAQVD